MSSALPKPLTLPRGRGSPGRRGSALSAASTIWRRSCRSRSGGSSGSPSGWRIALAGMILEAQNAIGIAGIAENITVGRPNRSSSRAIVAPQRLQVPQVAVRMTAWTPAASNSSPISRPKRRARSMGAPAPTVV